MVLLVFQQKGKHVVILLLEDVDALFVQRTAQQQRFSVTFSGLLNALDEKVGAEHYAVFLTADHGAAPGTAKRIDPEGLDAEVNKAVADAGLRHRHRWRRLR